MIYLWVSFYFLLGFSVLTTTANVIAPTSVECECFNATSSANNQDVCRDNVVQCVNIDPDRPAQCFVLWTTDNLTGETQVKMKGCFLDKACTNTECIDTSQAKKMNFCCCTGDMCNSKYKLMPTTTKPPKLQENIQPPDDINIFKYVGIIIAFLQSFF